MPTPLTDADKVLRNDTGKDIVEKLDDIAQALGVGVNADQINYDNTESGLEAEDVQNAIDELNDNKADKTDLDTTTSIITPAPVQTFSDGGDNIPLKSLVTEILPIQEGTGTPSPSNVRAISGHSSVNVFNSGKNLCPILSSQTINGVQMVASSDGTLTFNRVSSSTTVSDFEIPVQLPSGEYTISANNNMSFSGDVSSNTFFRPYDANGTSISVVQFNAVNKTYTFANSVSKIVIRIARQFSESNFTLKMQLEQGDTSTTYETYKGSNTTISLGSTVYGGSLECVKGEGQSNLGIIDLGDLTWSGPDATYNRFTTTVSGLISSGTRLTKLYCSCYQTIDDGRAVGDVPNNSIYTAAVAPSDRIYIHDTQYSSASDFTTAVTGQKLVFPITPTSLSVSGANIPTLSGLNNVYTDCGDIQSLEYYNNKTDELANLIRLMTRS